jgi:murein DD-endopeptidase MepM/ murein hydrolase activator NlpD
MPRLSLSVIVAGALFWSVGCAGDPPADSAARQHDVKLKADTALLQGLVPQNSTLDGLLRSHGLTGEATARLIAAAQPLFDPRRLRSAQPFSLVRTIEGTLRYFEYEIDADSFLRVTVADPETHTLRAEVLPIPKTREEAVAAGTIGGSTPSLFQAMDAAGEGPELSVALAEVFSGEIDFNSDVQPNDSFVVSFEKFAREGHPSSYGAINAAEFRNEGRVLRAFRFTPPGGKPDYFDEDGNSLRRFFLRTPLKFEPRITSRFSLSRMHPILHTERAHRGVDYAAPTGAPVVAVAAGTVISATFDRSNGRMVRLRHASGYESDYLHLSAFASGIRAGVHVSQGQLIGLVGSTGLATGPHLHYALKKNGTFVDPLREQRNLPPGEPVPASALAAFRAERDRALAEMSLDPSTPNHAIATH